MSAHAHGHHETNYVKIWAILVVLLAGLAGSIVPSVRASRVDPIDVLR